MVLKTTPLLLALALLQTTGVTSLSLEISPRHIHTGRIPTEIKVTCRADFNITACQFMWLAQGYEPGPLIDLSYGTLSQVNQSFLTTEVTHIGYHGNGLENGECGAHIQKRGTSPNGWWGLPDWVVGCRVLAQDGGWVYKWMDVVANYQYTLNYTVKPSDAAIFLPGKPAKFIAKSQTRDIHECSIEFMRINRTLNFNDGNLSDDSTGRHLYHGEGLYNGECGLELHNVTRDEIGMVRFKLYNQGWLSRNSAFIPIVAAIPPKQPVLRTVYNGKELTAQCYVLESCPRANMTWLIDDDVIRNDQFDNTPTSPEDLWAWPWVSVPTTQRVTVTLKPEHAGKTLKCVVSHLALAEPLVASETITFPDLGAINQEGTNTISSS